MGYCLAAVVVVVVAVAVVDEVADVVADVVAGVEGHSVVGLVVVDNVVVVVVVGGWFGVDIVAAAVVVGIAPGVVVEQDRAVGTPVLVPLRAVGRGSIDIAPWQDQYKSVGEFVAVVDSTEAVPVVDNTPVESRTHNPEQLRVEDSIVVGTVIGYKLVVGRGKLGLGHRLGGWDRSIVHQ